ncbi:MAG: hypothetical protein ACJ8AI_04835 [Rhodopila sp.]
MSISASIPTAFVDVVIGCLLPLLLRGTGGDAQAADALARHLLTEYHPRTAQELHLAGESITNRLKSMLLLAASAEPGIAAEAEDTALKWATSLTRAGHQAERKPDRLQRASCATHRPHMLDETGLDIQEQAGPPVEPAAPTTPEQTAETTPAGPATAPPADASPASEVGQAESKYNPAAKLLTLMKAHHKGAPPPHTKAAQDIQHQQRIVDAARMALQQARCRQVQAAVQSASTAIAA